MLRLPGQRMKVTFRSGPLELEGDLVLPTDCSRATVICHPHPQYGGDMDNAVVCAVAGALQEVGYATLRFNFRGVGRSSGAYGGGVAEIDDARAAVRYVSEQTGAIGIALAGYSFGAVVALQAGATLGQVHRLIAVAPPLAFFSLDSIAQCTKEKLFIIGDHDEFCSVSKLGQELDRVSEPKRLRVLPGADHFFFGHEKAVAAAITDFVA